MAISTVSLYQDIDHIPVPVHGLPQIVEFALDLHEDFVRVPDVSQPSLLTPEIPSVAGADHPTPLPDGLMGDDDSPLRGFGAWLPIVASK
jgi:hypothetical protein